jgi:hypothetical protein
MKSQSGPRFNESEVEEAGFFQALRAAFSESTGTEGKDHEIKRKAGRIRTENRQASP